MWRLLISLLILLGSACAQDAARDIQMGMQGLAEATKDPAMLAQLLADMQVRLSASE